jgi:hypothetical protein
MRFVSKYFSAFIALASILIIAGIIFMYAFPFNVAEIRKINLVGEVTAGSSIKYNVDYCRYVGKGTETYTRRFLIPENTDINAIELSSNPNLETLDGITGCRTTKKPITLPVGLEVPAGKYKLLIQVRYCIFIGRCIPVEGYSDTFEIKKPNIADQLSLINRQLEAIRNAQPGVQLNSTDNLSNTITVQEPAQAPIPNTEPQEQQVTTQVVQTPAATPEASPSLIQSIITITQNTVTGLRGIVGI